MGDRPNDVGRQAVQISNALTKNHREHFGRGAGSVKTVINRGFVITFLEEIYTPLERTMIEGGRADLVHEARLAFQAMMRETYVGIVEDATGRKVRAFLSQNHIGPDIAAEIFVLEAEPGDTSDIQPEAVGRA
jgi:uncharacterized protein YbcI